MSEANNIGTFSGANNIIITGGTFNKIVHPVTESSQKWMKTLRANAASGALHNSGERRDPPKCHPGTRELVNREIMDWVWGTGCLQMERFLWIYGPAGTSKSSIAQTIAELCEKEGSLASDFFFSRTVSKRNTDTKLISTLACQLTVSIPDIRPYMAAAIASDTLIFSRSLQVQLNTLILKPFAQLISSNNGASGAERRPYPNLIIINDLDECRTPESQRDILSALSSTPSLIFIIASRPKHAIRGVFNESLHAHTRRIILDDHYKPDKDIRKFLYSKFSDIKRSHPMASQLAAGWPTSADVDSIVQKASGQFIYASTVMKFTASRNLRPTKALNIILTLQSSGNHTPFADLDALYTTILESVDKENLEKALTVFAFLLVTSTLTGPYIKPIKRTMGLIEGFLGYDSGELYIVLDDLHSIVDIPPKADQELRLFHASLGDFLLDKSRSKGLFVDMGLFRVKFVKLCVNRLSSHFEDLSSIKSLSDVDQYTCWIFLELFAGAHPDENLLQNLANENFPISLFIKFMFSGAPSSDACHQMLEHLPYLFDWIEMQDMELYNAYAGYLDDYLKPQMVLDLRNPRWQYIFTTLTLYDKVKISLNSIQHLSDLFHDNSSFIEHFFSSSSDSLSSFHKDIDFILSRLSRLLTDPTLSLGAEYCHVDVPNYIELAIEFFDLLTSPELAQRAIRNQNEEVEDLTLRIFFATLQEVPAEQKLGEYLHDNRHREYSDKMRNHEIDLRSIVNRYIKNCNLPSSVTKMEPLFATHAVTSDFSVPSLYSVSYPQQTDALHLSATTIPQKRKKGHSDAS